MSIEEQIADAVEEGLVRALGPYLRRLADPEPLVYTVHQAATVLQVSEDTIGRLVRRGVLPRIPHLEGRVLVPKAAVERLIDETAGVAPAVATRSA